MEKMTYCINDINADASEMVKWTYNTLQEAVEAIKEWIEKHEYMWDDADIYAELYGEYAKYDNATEYAKENVVIFKWDYENGCPERIYDYEGIRID